MNRVRATLNRNPVSTVMQRKSKSKSKSKSPKAKSPNVKSILRAYGPSLKTRSRPMKSLQFGETVHLQKYEIEEGHQLRKFGTKSNTKKVLDFPVSVAIKPKSPKYLSEMEAAAIVNPYIARQPAYFKAPGAVRGIVNELMKRRKSTGAT